MDPLTIISIGDLLALVRTCHRIVTDTTSYLSTLPHSIEVVEEHLAVVAVISTLLNSLNTSIQRFPALNLSVKKSFIAPLCQDIRLAFATLDNAVQQAQKLKVFEPSDVGLVRVPASAWIMVHGTEAKSKSLRSRLYVEKYRVRVLIDAVCYFGLKGIDSASRTQQQKMELEKLENMLPLIAERLGGVWRDYRLRLGGRKLGEEGLQLQREQMLVLRQMQLKRQMMAQQEAQGRILMQQQQQAQMGNQQRERNKSMQRSRSADSLSSSCSEDSVTLMKSPPHHETYLLRNQPSTKTLAETSSFLSLPLKKKYTYTPSTYYIKPLASSASEIQSYLSPPSLLSLPAIHKKILGMEDNAQWEIQKLVESRENATSPSNAKREWNVVSLVERPRRKIAALEKRGIFGRKRAQKEGKEWVLVLEGRTTSTEKRITPDKNANPWSPIPAPPKTLSTGPIPTYNGKGIQNAGTNQINIPQTIQSQQQRKAAPLRFVETRRIYSKAEAERKMEEMFKDLFVCASAADDEESDEVDSDEEIVEGEDSESDSDYEEEEEDEEDEKVVREEDKKGEVI